MKIEGIKLYLVILATFVVVFLMNYLGSDAEDRLYRASLNGLGGAVGIGIGLWWMNKKGKDTDQHHFD